MSGLALQLNDGEDLFIGEALVRVYALRRGVVKVWIEAPRDIQVVRGSAVKQAPKPVSA